MKKHLLISLGTFLVVFYFFSTSRNQTSINFEPKIEESKTSQDIEKLSKKQEVVFVGPRENIPNNSPTALGFWSFAVPRTGIIARSGQPTIEEYRFLKLNGYKSVIDLRTHGEYVETNYDTNLPGFKDLEFNYLSLEIRDGGSPTTEQASQFLDFISKPENLPVLIHCRGGYGRTGTMVALYRFTLEKWPMEKAIEESRLFHGGISDGQRKWLLTWEKNNPQN